MNPTLNKIYENLAEYNNFFTKNELYPIQKAYTTPHFLVLMVRVPGRTFGIYIGRGHQYMGIWTLEKAPPSFLRIQDKFLDYVRSHLVGVKMGKIEFSPRDSRAGEVFKFRFKTDTDDNFFTIGYFERELFFARKEGPLTFCSWNNQIVENEEVTWPMASIEKHFKNYDLLKYFEEEEKKSEGIVEQKKRTKFLIRKKYNIESDLKMNEGWKSFEEAIVLDQVDLNQTEIKVGGHNFKLIGLRTEWEKKDFLFKRIKKIKRGEGLLRERLAEVEAELKDIESGQFVRKITKEKAIQINWKSIAKNRSSNNDENTKIKNQGVKNIFLGTISGQLGLNSSGNDYIRKNAHKDFYWFHIENHPGAHCILKTDDVSKINNDVLSLVASLLRDYSRLEIRDIPMMFTQVKNIKGMKGVQGEVIAKKVKYITCPYRNWKEIITIV